MILLFASAVMWTLYFCQRRPRLPILRSIDVYFADGNIQQSRCIDELPIGEQLVAYGVKYTVGDRTYVARSSMVAWPIRLRTPRVRVEHAEFRGVFSSSPEVITERVRRWAGANCDFHLERNALTWGDLIRHDRGSLTISFQRYRWYWPFSCTQETFTTDMDQPLINVKPYVT